MGLGSTAAKLKQLVSMVEQVFEQMKELRDRVQELDETIDDMDQRLDRIDARGKREEALLSAIAEKEGIDVESLVEEPSPRDSAADQSAGDASESPTTAESGVDSAE
jgi:predicted RNase H-like nuclease (RuvC/YqgF family)